RRCRRNMQESARSAGQRSERCVGPSICVKRHKQKPGRKSPSLWAPSKGTAAGPGVSISRPGSPFAHSPTRRESEMSGRHAIGPELAEKLEGSEVARTRMRVVLETIAGKKRVLEACAEL